MWPRREGTRRKADGPLQVSSETKAAAGRWRGPLGVRVVSAGRRVLVGATGAYLRPLTVDLPPSCSEAEPPNPPLTAVCTSTRQPGGTRGLALQMTLTALSQASTSAPELS